MDWATNDGDVEPSGSAPRLRLLVVHDHALFRQGLRALLADSDIEVVADAAVVSDAVRLDVTPDVIISYSARADGEAVRALRERFAAVPIVVAGPAEGFNLAEAAINDGASGYITATATLDEFVRAIRSVVDGEPFLQPSVGVKMAHWRADRNRAAQRLSTIEREILRRIALGYTNREIASARQISLRTVESHRAGIVRKLGLRDRAALFDYALRAGLIDLDSSRALDVDPPNAEIP